MWVLQLNNLYNVVGHVNDTRSPQSNLITAHRNYLIIYLIRTHATANTLR